MMPSAPNRALVHRTANSDHLLQPCDLSTCKISSILSGVYVAIYLQKIFLFKFADISNKVIILKG
jgi:hypothetical protein